MNSPSRSLSIFLLNKRRIIEILSEGHLLQAVYRSRLHVDLLCEKLKHRLDQIMIEVKVIVGHLRRQHQEGLPLALLMKLLRVLEGDQGISLTMNDESGALNVDHRFQIIKMLGHHLTEQPSKFALYHIPDRGVRRHQDQSPWSIG